MVKISKDYNNLYSGVKYLGIVTGKEFEEAYNEMSASPDKTPVASTLLPVAQGDTKGAIDIRVQAWIFYKLREQPVASKPKKLSLIMEL